jgi:hypothetical protein
MHGAAINMCGKNFDYVEPTVTDTLKKIDKMYLQSKVTTTH